MRIAALIPAYREEKSVAGVVRETRKYLSDVLVIDDGSDDGTGAEAVRAGARILKNPVNVGKGASLIAGLDRLFGEGFEAVVCLDADGQHLPAEIPRFLAAAETADLIIGNRMLDTRGMPWIRLWTNRVTSWLISGLAGKTVPDVQCGFRLLRREAWRQAAIKGRRYDFEAEMVVVMGRKGLGIGQVPVSTIYGGESSSIRPLPDTLRFFRLIWRLWRNKGG
ncbi:MAG: glycosyltransferase family 2 protein [Planctomycetota bacterium]|jgi:glycosyltransferase involved in cell wall biosynthesis|nr:glycosyltransferase family 2 protein [Planctomycetota bacterium]